MSILDRFFKKKPVLDLEDPVFGHLTFDDGIWIFIPDAAEGGFMVTVEAPGSGPTREQRAFFQEVKSRLSDFQQRARDYMRSRVDGGVDVASVSVYCVELGGAEESKRGQFVLELSDSEEDLIHRVSFRGGQAVDYGCDD